MKLNWNVKFSRNNVLFIIRLIAAILIPVIPVMGLRWQDLNTWTALWTAVMDFISNPYLIGLVIFNAINILPDPTTKGLSDSERDLQHKKTGGKE